MARLIAVYVAKVLDGSQRPHALWWRPVVLSTGRLPRGERGEASEARQGQRPLATLKAASNKILVDLFPLLVSPLCKANKLPYT